MNQRRDTRNEVLQLAMKLFYEHGFRGFSYGDIAGPLGIKPAAIHYHFASKDDLGVAIVDAIRERLKTAIAHYQSHQTPWPQQLEGLFAYYRDHAGGECGVCAVGVGAAELTAIPHAMQLQIRLLIKELLNHLALVLARGRDAGDFQFDGRSEDRATLVMAALGGALQLQRITGLPQLEIVIGELREGLGLND